FGELAGEDRDEDDVVDAEHDLEQQQRREGEQRLRGEEGREIHGAPVSVAGARILCPPTIAGRIRTRVSSPPPPSTLAAGLVGGLAAELVAGRHRDLLAPLEFLEPGERPAGRPRAVDRAPLARALEIANAAAGHSRA